MRSESRVLRLPVVGLFMYALALVLLGTTAVPLHAQATGAITGTVVVDDQPVSGATIRAFAGQRQAGAATTGAAGTFRIGGLEAGTYRLVTRRIGAAPLEQSVTVVAGGVADVRISLASAPTQLSEVVVTGVGAPVMAGQAPASITVLGEARIAETPAVTVTDHMRGVPGIDVGQVGIAGGPIVARGFNNAFSGTLLTLIDHRFASVPSLRVNVPFLFTTSNEDIERIEVMLGPAAALYGPNSANGVLHVITKSPFTSQGTTVTLDAGERSLVRVAGRHAMKFNEAFAFKITGEAMRAREWEYNDPGEPAVFPNTPNTPRSRVGAPNQRDFDIERMGGEARLDWRRGETTSWINTYGVTRAGSSIELTGANGAGQIRDWTMQSLQSRFRTGKLFAQVFANFSDAGNDDSTDVSGTYILRTGQPIVDKSRVVAAQVQHSWDATARHSLVYGVDYIFTNPRTGNTINGRNEDFDNTNEVGGYVQSTSHLTSKLDLLLAARFDRHSLFDDVFFSPRAALVLNPSTEHSLRLTFNRAYSTPANFSYFLDLLQAGNISGLPFNVRAVGVPETGFTFRRDCTGGAGSLCMRSPFTPAAAGGSGAFVPANAAAYYPAALGVAIAGGLRNSLIASGMSAGAADATIARLQSFNAVQAGVQTNLTYITNQVTVAPAAVTDIAPLEASFTNVLELGYKGLLGRTFYFAADLWYQRRENFTTAAANFTPNTLLHGPTLGAGLVAHLTPVLGAQAAAAVGASVANSLARIPLGTVVPDSRVTTNGDIAFTYRTIDETIDVQGVDLSFDFRMTPAVSMLGTASWVSDAVFEEIESGARSLMLNAPERKGSLTLRGESAVRRLTGEVRARYQSAFPVNSAVYVTGIDLTGPNGTYQYEEPPASTFLDAMVSWRMPERIGRSGLLSVSGTNLTNRKVPMFAGVPSIGRLIMTRLQFTF